MKTLLHILFVLCVGTVQWFFAAILIFYGTVLNPTLQHQFLQVAGILLTLPFSMLLFLFPRLLTEGYSPYVGFLGGLCWAELYWQIGSRPYYPRGRPSANGTPTA